MASKDDPHRQRAAARPGVLLGLGRFFHWRRKRFWFITLPFACVFSMFATVAILFAIPNVKPREISIGSWKIAEIKAADYQRFPAGGPPTGFFRSRGLTLGKFGIVIDHYFDNGDTFDSKTRGFRLNAKEGAPQLSWITEQWRFRFGWISLP